MNGPTSYPNPALRTFTLSDGAVQQPTLWYRFNRAGLRVLMPAVWKVRVFERRFEPTDGGAVYICNHQSFLDPILMSFALVRPMNYMARDSLFRVPGFRRLIASVNAFPVKRGSADTGAIKEALRRLKAGGQVAVFAEGTRTLDGKIAPLLPGLAVLAQRAADWTVPVVIDGAFEAWPRWQPLPGPGSVVVQYAPPLSREQVRQWPAAELTKRLRQTLIDMQTDVRRRLGRPELTY